MPRSFGPRRLAVLGLLCLAAAGLSACSGGIDRYEYTAPVSATAAPAPAPVVPAAMPVAGASRRLPLLPPVPEEQSGLPPVSVAQLPPPPVY